METYLVGGAVRDKLLNIPVKDRDWVVVGATVTEMLDLNFKQVGKDFPVFIHPQTKEEYALARTERKIGKGYTGFSVHTSPEVSLDEDLQRRDITINAMAEDSEGMLIDPFNGQADIQNKILRHVSPAFTEDPLRVLRVARFAARFSHLGFTIAKDTMKLMASMVSADELETLVVERVWQEIHTALGEQSPHVFFQVLRECGALAQIMPEVNNLFGVPQPAKYHPEIDTGIHTLMVLEQAARLSNKPVVRFAALMHDVGKAATPQEKWPGHKQHEELGVALIEELAVRLKVPNDYKDLARLVSLHHTACHRADKHTAAEILATLEKVDAFRRPQRFIEFLLACEADARGRKGLEQMPYPQPALLKKAFDIALTVDTQTIIAAGFTDQQIGEELTRLRVSKIASQLKLST